MKWEVFWEQFDAAVHSNSSLDQASKLTYFREAIKDTKVILSSIEPLPSPHSMKTAAATSGEV